MKKNKPKAPAVFYIAIVILFLTMLSISLSGGFFAKYVSVAEGSDEARVAAYNVTVTELTPSSVTLDSYNPEALSAEMEFSVISKSEVAVKYNVVVMLDEPLPAEYVVDADTGVTSETPEPYVTIKLGDVSNGIVTLWREPEISDDGRTLTFANVGTFAPVTEGQLVGNHTLLIEVVAGRHEKNTVTLDGMNVRVNVEQIN